MERESVAKEVDTFRAPFSLAFFISSYLTILIIGWEDLHVGWEIFAFSLLMTISESHSFPNVFESRVSLGSLVETTVILILNPIEASFAAGLAMLLSEVGRPISIQRLAVNVSLISLSVYVPAKIYRYLYQTLLWEPLLKEGIVGLIAIAFYLLLNISFVTLALCEWQKAHFGKTFLELLKNGWITTAVATLGIPLSLIYNSSLPIYFSVITVILLVSQRALAANQLQQENEVLDNKYRDSRVYTEDLVRSLINGVLAVDQAGMITVANQAGTRICGTKQGVEGKRAEGIVPQTILDMMQKAMAESASTSLEVGVETPVAGRRQIACNVSPLRNSHGEVIGAVSVMDDITEQKVLEKELARQDRVASLGRFSAGILHEIANPLAALRAAMETTCEGLKDEETRQSLTIGLRKLNELERLAQKLLHFSRPAAKSSGSTELGEAAGEILRMITPQARKLRVKVEWHSGKAVWVKADPMEIRHVLLNLLSNALQAMPEGGRLAVETGMGGPDAAWEGTGIKALGSIPPDGATKTWGWIKITDTGAGIRPEALARMGELFFTTREEGNGLGLFLVGRILERAGGRLEIASVPGQGTRVTAYLALAEQSLPVDISGAKS